MRCYPTNGPLNRIGSVHCKYERNILLHETVYYHCAIPFASVLSCALCVMRVWFVFHIEEVNFAHFQTVVHKCKAHGTYYNVVAAVLVVSAAFQLRQKNENSINEMLFDTLSKCFHLWQVFALWWFALRQFILIEYIRMKYHRPTLAETTEAKGIKFKLKKYYANKEPENIITFLIWILCLLLLPLSDSYRLSIFRLFWMKVYWHDFISCTIK